jgi:hypothetical protein
MTRAARDGAFVPERFHTFFAIDPDDTNLAFRLEKLLHRGLISQS